MSNTTTEITLIDSEGNRRVLEGKEREEWLVRTYTAQDLMDMVPKRKEGKTFEVDDDKLWLSIEGILGSLWEFAKREAERHIETMKQMGL